ncbi:MAG: acetate uptake transporter [Spirochaetales bacterium]|nr:acetate uptake transporter [Spirochaetales bacterium]
MSIKDNSANPAPLGLLGFGLTTVLLNIHNAGIYELNSMIMGMGIFYGGIAQLIAGIQESKKGNTFGATAFTSYGAFWLSLVAIWLLPSLGIAQAATPGAMGFYLLLWGILTFGLFVAVLKGKLIGKLVFGSLTLLFLLLAISDFTGSHLIHTIAGIEGIICGSLAIYEGLGIIINEKYNKEVLPMG